MFYKVLILATVLVAAYAVNNNETSSPSNYTGIPLPYTPAVARVVARALGIEHYETVLDEDVRERRPRILEEAIDYPTDNSENVYSYGYEVHDSLTGDSKTQYETRRGDVVQGSYSLIDADGFRRIVEYTADPVEGFKAVVRREPLAFTPAARIQDYGFNQYGYDQH